MFQLVQLIAVDNFDVILSCGTPRSYIGNLQGGYICALQRPCILHMCIRITPGYIRSIRCLHKFQIGKVYIQKRLIIPVARLVILRDKGNEANPSQEGLRGIFAEIITRGVVQGSRGHDRAVLEESSIYIVSAIFLFNRGLDGNGPGQISLLVGKLNINTVLLLCVNPRPRSCLLYTSDAADE